MDTIESTGDRPQPTPRLPTRSDYDPRTHRLRGDVGNDPAEMLSPRRVRELTGLSGTSIWRLRRKGDFVQALRLSPGRIAFRRGDVEDWLASRQAGR